jgi:hypothetical protein
MSRKRPTLTVEQVLAWADAHHARTGRRPAVRSGPVPEAPGETWVGIDLALRRGARGLPGGYSLARLLALLRGASPPRPGRRARVWTAEEDAWVRALPAPEAARRVGCSIAAVYSRRRLLGIPPGGRRRLPAPAKLTPLPFRGLRGGGGAGRASGGGMCKAWRGRGAAVGAGPAAATLPGLRCPAIRSPSSTRRAGVPEK